MMIELDQVSLSAGTFALRDVTLRIAAGRHAVLMGRTGAGKTTLLEGVCGLRRVTAGAIRIDGVDVTAWTPGRRGIGFVPQDGALFEHLTVREHLAFGLSVRGWHGEAVAARVAELARWLGLERLLERRPGNLSGGEAQRVALGRAMAFHPRVLCLDEPLSALDEETRGETRRVLQELRQRTGVTVLHVTHSPADARELGDLGFRLEGGRVSEDASILRPGPDHSSSGGLGRDSR